MSMCSSREANTNAQDKMLKAGLLLPSALEGFVPDAQEDLDAADSLQDVNLKLRIFDAVIREIMDVHPYAKMALGMLSCAANIILVQVDHNPAVLRLFNKFITS
jgi:hypothetical protein